MEEREAKEVREIREVKGKSDGVAAFFDLDGTLMPMPSMEKRFISALRYKRTIGLRSYLLWLAEAVRLAPRGISQILHANKMYLRGVALQEAMPLPPFYPEAIERVNWHAARGDLIVIVSGTLEPLAERAARALEALTSGRGPACEIRVCATRLEEKKERWTGRIVGEAIFGEAKARAIRRLAAEANLDFERCFAYGDSLSDWWMLDAVGKPAAVNPSSDLARIARRNDWLVVRWGREKDFTQSAGRTQRAQRTERIEKRLRAESVNTRHGA